MEADVGVGTGVMKPLLSKLYRLLKEDRAILKGLRRQIEDMKDEMMSMEAVLTVLADAEQLDPEMRFWRDYIRELSYDMEDCVDDLVARVDHERGGSPSLKKIFGKLLKLKPPHEISRKIEMLKSRAIDANKRYTFYPPSYSEIDPRLHALYVDVCKLVGIDHPKRQIIEWVKKEDSTLIPVVSIVGTGGLGKTTLANAVFRAIRDQFSCAAFVMVSRKPNMRNVLRDIAMKLGIPDYKNNDNERVLIDRLRNHLRDKRCLVVIDDIWSEEAWYIIRDALLNNDNGSRIITTTRNSTVASFCSSQGGYIYRMEPLSPTDSRRLFLERAFGAEKLCPGHLKRVSERILEKCNGLPLAIITMSSLLADETAEQVWKRALSSIGSSLAMEHDAGNMTKILSLSYFDLPHSKRTCLLYLSAYPEDHIIEKQSLIHKWIAEGFITEIHGRSEYEVGEGYFNDLINRTLIQPARLPYSQLGHGEEDYGQVLACRVHDIILDFITCMAEKENFMTSFVDAEQENKYKVRRLSAVTSYNGKLTLSGDLCHIRSLVMFGYFGQNTVLDFPALRVLDLGDCQGLQDEHLAYIEKLVLLKYLRLGSTSITMIPGGIEELKYLETLDMRGIRIRNMPSTMTRLQRLTRLYADFHPSCLLDGVIGQLQSLEELENVMVFNTELEKFLSELGQLTKLRTLSITVRYPLDSRGKDDEVRFVGTLMSSYSIHHLRIRCAGFKARNLLSLESWRPVNPAAFREICIDDYYIDKVPNWMTYLVNLRGLDLIMYRTAPEDVAILGRIPALVFLKLETSYGKNGMIFISGFKSLKYFKLELSYCGTTVEFEEGSMPKLEHLKLDIRAHKMKCMNYASHFGIQHLSALTKVDLFIDGNNDIMDKIIRLVRTALGKLRSNPTLSLSRRGSDCYHFEEYFRQSYQFTRGVAFGSFLDRIVKEINQDARPRSRVLDETDE